MPKHYIKAYLSTWMQLAKSPRQFFGHTETQERLSPTFFLAVSSIVSALSAMLLGPHTPSLLGGAIVAVNGFGMTLLAVAFAYPVAMPLARGKVSFSRMYGIFAHSSGVTLLISWNPVLLLIAEPWKWWLIWTGMRQGCGMARSQAAVVLVLTVGMIILLFQILLPLTSPTPGRP